MIDYEKVVAWKRIITEFKSRGIFYEILENKDIQFLDSQYDEGTSIIEKYMPGFGKTILN